jgi:hypothetical protein
MNLKDSEGSDRRINDVQQSICLEGLRKATKNFIQNSRCPEVFPNSSHGRYRYCNPLGDILSHVDVDIHIYTHTNMYERV